MNKKILFAFLSLIISVPIITLAQNADVDPQGSSSCVSISNNLRYRATDAQTSGDVSVLQDFLQASGYLKASPSGYMGLLTVKGVKAFQSDNSISPTGYVGPLTRAKIQTVSCAGTTVNIPTNTTSNNQNGTTNISGCASGALFSSTTGASCSSTVNTTQNTTQYTTVALNDVSKYANINQNNFISTSGTVVGIDFSSVGGSVLLTDNAGNYLLFSIAHAFAGDYTDVISRLKKGDSVTVKGVAASINPNFSNLGIKFGVTNLPNTIGMINGAGLTITSSVNPTPITCSNGATNPPHCNADTINPTSKPFISMISPIGGETLIQSGTNQTTTNTISWNGWGFGAVHIFLTSSDATTVNPPSLGVIWTGTPTNTNSIIWDGKTVCQSWFGSSGSNCNVISPGSYKIYIVGDLTTGGTVNAVSNSSFTILRQSSTTISPSPISINNGKCGLVVNSLQANDKVSFPLVVTGNIDNSNSQGLGCSWQMFEGQAGSAQLYFNYQNQGWKPVGTSAPIKVSDWTATKTSFSTTLNFNNGGIGLSYDTPMRITFTEENAAAIRPSLTFDLPIKF